MGAIESVCYDLCVVNMNITQVSLIVLCINAGLGESINILTILPTHGFSHFHTFDALITGLSEKGHNITFLGSQIPKATRNVQHVPLIFNQETKEIMTFEILQLIGGGGAKNFLASMQSIYAFKKISSKSCGPVLKSQQVFDFMNNPDNQYDIVITEAFATNCYVSFATKFGAPLVLFSSSMLMPWYYSAVGQPENPAYIPAIMSGLAVPMKFFERIRNFLELNIMKYAHRFYIAAENYQQAKEMFGEDLVDMEDTLLNTSLILTNTHFALNTAKPNVPSVIEVGGIHVQKPKMLPKNIEKWINESKDGVIYFSMGSMIKGHTFPEDKRKIFLRAFGRLKQRVLWKWENETMPGKPDNVMIQKWMPQFDILSHPNVKAFISHGGLLGTTEAVHCGVPVVVMPQFGDQHTNARALEAGGGGVVLNFREADEEMVYNALKTVLDPEFNKKAKELSARFRDRPMSPMDTAIYWIEYVARHKGAHHMRTAAVGMPLYQYLLLDVFAFLALVGITILIVTIYVTKFFWRLLLSFFSSSNQKTKKVKKN